MSRLEEAERSRVRLLRRAGHMLQHPEMYEDDALMEVGDDLDEWADEMEARSGRGI